MLQSTGLYLNSGEVGATNRFFTDAYSTHVKVDLRTMAGPILDQGPIGSCMENALVSAIDIMMRQANHEIAPLSRMQSYADTRVAQGSFSTDSGSAPEATLDMAVAKGLAFESSWAYNMNLLYQHPPQSVVDEAAQHKAMGWEQVDLYQNSSGIRNTIAGLLDQGKPVILGFRPHQYFFNEHGPLATQINFGTDSMNVGHAVVIVGVDDNLNGGSYIVKNSWGTGWGDGGYGTIKYTQFPSPFPDDFLGAYALTGFNGLNFSYNTARTEVANNYAMILGRAAETSGMDFWASFHLSDDQIATSMLNSTEGQAIWGHTTNAQFVERMYENILGRHSDTAGFNFFVGLLDHGANRGSILSSTMNSIESPSAEKAAHDFYMNKTNVADYISIAMQYSGGQDQVTHDILSHITSDAVAMEIIKVGVPDVMGYI